ncbi:hypothetical protein RP20_CCG017082 [Aedes albopictus]|nr:hypothetical protein RP20_CCG017082 [Aedes albopictus]
MSSAFRILFHGLTALHYFYAMYYDLVVIDEYPKEIKELFGGLASNEKYKLPLKGRVIFLTYWGLVFASSSSSALRSIAYKHSPRPTTTLTRRCPSPGWLGGKRGKLVPFCGDILVIFWSRRLHRPPTDWVGEGVYVLQNSAPPGRRGGTMTSVQLYKSRTFVLVWHLIAIGQYYYAIYFDRYFVKIPEDLNIPKMMRPSEYGGRSKFLTYWCLVSMR